MSRFGILLLLFPLLAAEAQIGLPFPRRGKKTTTTSKDQQEALSHFEGNLRKFDPKEITFELDDARTMVAAVGDHTKYEKKGQPFEPDKMKPGDRIGVDASVDENGLIRAATVEWIREGTDAERARVAPPIVTHPKFSDEEKEKQSASSREDGDERPVFRRKNEQPAKPEADQPKAKPEQAKVKAEEAKAEAEPALPPPTMVRPPDPKPEADDPGPPKLQRGRARATTRQASDDEPVTVASTSTPPSTRPETDAPAVKAPPPPVEEPKRDEFLEQARETATGFIETLPNYLVLQVMTRFVSENAGPRPNWQAQDNISADVVYQDGHESYKNVKRDGKPAAGKVEEGSWSTGEFGTVLADVFHPSTAAKFVRAGSDTLSGRSTVAYRFTVDQAHSHWTVYGVSQIYRPAYRGSVWIDRETHRVLRLEMEARNMPDGFPFDKVETATDYDFVRIGEGKYLVPTHSENLACQAGTRQCSRNVIDWRNYRKFGADSSIAFDSPKADEAKPAAQETKPKKKK